MNQDQLTDAMAILQVLHADLPRDQAHALYVVMQAALTATQQASNCTYPSCQTTARCAGQCKAATPKCIGYLDKFGNFKRELPAWMTEEPGVNWREVADLQECTQLHERVAELEQTLAFLTGPKRPIPSVLVHTRLGADVLYDGVSWDKQNANTLHVHVSSAALDAKTNRIIELERELKLKGQP